jgi:hypothetical protein
MQVDQAGQRYQAGRVEPLRTGRRGKSTPGVGDRTVRHDKVGRLAAQNPSATK